jgi:hypothetical protein
MIAELNTKLELVVGNVEREAGGFDFVNYRKSK